MDKNKIIIRDGYPDDFESIRSLFKDVWGYQRPKKYDEWRWFSAEKKKCRISLAWDGSHLVGAYMAGPVLITLGEEIVQGAHAMDVMVRAEYTGQLIFTRLGEHCKTRAQEEGFQVFYAFPNPLSFPGFVGRLKWGHIGDVGHWVRPIVPSKYERIPTWAGPLINGVTNILPKGPNVKADLKICELDMLEVGELLEKNSSLSGPISIYRDLDRIKWRYSKSTNYDYQCIGAFCSGKIEAIGIWGMRNETWGNVQDYRAHLTELIGSNLIAFQAIIRMVIESAFKREAMLLETATNVAPFEKLLRRAGFLKHRRMPMVLTLLDSKLKNSGIETYFKWEVFGGDVDTF